MAVDRLRKKIGKGRHRSAMKRQRQTIKRTERNRAARSALKTAVKKVRASRSPEALKIAIRVIDKTASKGIIPKKRASRLVSRLTKYVAATA
jgi:small subunit ribosomal protein S20